MQFLVSAGEASGDLYASGVVHSLSALYPQARFYGCAGPKLQGAGVESIVDATRLAVVGLAEVVGHLPRIYGEYRKLIAYAKRQPPDAALLTDSPDFHLRLARHLKRMRVPIYYLVAPQVWAWRQNRVKTIRQLVDKLFCLFPFEEQWFRERGVDATYIGHPLATMARTTLSRNEFLEKYQLPRDRRTVVLLPGSRTGEACRHLPVLLQSAAELRERFPLSLVWATPRGFYRAEAFTKFRERVAALSIQIIENDIWNCIGHADLALAASGTVTMEAAILGTPTVTFYKVNPFTWAAGRRLVKAPFLSMVNLIAERQIVPELIQHEMTAARLIKEAELLLESAERADRMRIELGRVRASLIREGNPFERAASLISMDLSARTPELHASQETIK